MDIPNNVDNCLLFKKNIEYKWARFIQASKISKRLIIMFFSNLTLALIPKHLSYKNVDKIKIPLIKLLYDKVNWWIRSLSIRLITTNVALNKYLIYYLDIIPAIQFLIGH